MSEPIKLDASEVEFWKACLISAIQWSCNPSEEADNAVMALRERVANVVGGAIYSTRCPGCGNRFTSTAPMALNKCPICGHE